MCSDHVTNKSVPNPESKPSQPNQIVDKRSMMLISVQIPVHMLRQLEQLVLQGKYPNRSEAIRYAIRDFIRREIKEE